MCFDGGQVFSGQVMKMMMMMIGGQVAAGVEANFLICQISPPSPDGAENLTDMFKAHDASISMIEELLRRLLVSFFRFLKNLNPKLRCVP